MAEEGSVDPVCWVRIGLSDILDIVRCEIYDFQQLFFFFFCFGVPSMWLSLLCNVPISHFMFLFQLQAVLEIHHHGIFGVPNEGRAHEGHSINAPFPKNRIFG